MERFGRKLERQDPRLPFCYEAGPTGYGLDRPSVALGHRCEVVAPSLVPRRPGDHVKTNRRDAITLARLLRAGELSGIWGPDAGHEAVRDLVRVRSAAGEDLRKKRQQWLSFLLRHGRVLTGRRSWGPAHTRWLAAQKFDLQPCRSCSRIRLTPSRMPGDDGSGLRLSGPNSGQPGRWRRSCRPIKLCVACLSWLLSRLQARSAMVAGSTVHGT